MRSQALQTAKLIASNRLSSLRNLKMSGNTYIQVIGDKMKTLSEHERDNRIPDFGQAWLRVACDHCGGELYNPEPGIMLMTDPPKITVRCSKCDFKGYMTR